MAAASSADDEAMNTFNQLKRKVLTSRSALNQAMSPLVPVSSALAATISSQQG